MLFIVSFESLEKFCSALRSCPILGKHGCYAREIMRTSWAKNGENASALLSVAQRSLFDP